MRLPLWPRDLAIRRSDHSAMISPHSEPDVDQVSVDHLAVCDPKLPSSISQPPSWNTMRRSWLRTLRNPMRKSSSMPDIYIYIRLPVLTCLDSLNLCDLFLTLPNELQAQIIAPLPIHTILELRLVSKSFHTLVTLNESPIARYHIAHSLPNYALRLYPLPDPSFINLHYLCSIWHRLNVAEKLALGISAQATKEIFSRTTEAQQREFEPQHRRMRSRLTPLIFALFHFFETFRDLHVRHLETGGTPLRLQPYTLNPLECQVMALYDDQTLLKLHQVFPLIISSFSRRLRPPSYAGSIERSFKGYLKGRPADEVYATIISVGGLRQAQRFWEMKGYNSRRAAVDVWYGLVTRSPVEPAPKSKMALNTHLGRKKPAPTVEASTLEYAAPHDANACKEWFCVKPTCQAARRRHSTDNLVFHSSLAAGPPMAPLSRSQLQLVLPDLQHLSNIWMHTAEALILQRKIVERPQDIKRNTQVLLELIRDDRIDEFDHWTSGNTLVPTRSIDIEQGGITSDRATFTRSTEGAQLHRASTARSTTPGIHGTGSEEGSSYRGPTTTE